jgi:hypothetical protein
MFYPAASAYGFRGNNEFCQKPFQLKSLSLGETQDIIYIIL